MHFATGCELERVIPAQAVSFREQHGAVGQRRGDLDYLIRGGEILPEGLPGGRRVTGRQERPRSRRVKAAIISTAVTRTT